MVKEKIPNETPRKRFERLAAIRTNKVIEKLRILGNCSNPGMYEYSQEDMDKIFLAINKELRRAKAKFEKPQKVEFNFE